MISLNSTVDAVHPCLMPLVSSISISLFFSSCLAYNYIISIKSIMLLTILNSFSICAMVSLFIESYAFLKSIAIATICSFFLYVSSMHSLRINRLSKIFPPLVNSACSNLHYICIFFARMCRFFLTLDGYNRLFIYSFEIF